MSSKRRKCYHAIVQIKLHCVVQVYTFSKSNFCVSFIIYMEHGIKPDVFLEFKKVKNIYICCVTEKIMVTSTIHIRQWWNVLILVRGMTKITYAFRKLRSFDSHITGSMV